MIIYRKLSRISRIEIKVPEGEAPALVWVRLGYYKRRKI